jgi:anti-sigma factor RsiW
MKCEEAEELVSPYIDGELTQSKAQLLESHLAGCARCKATLERYQRLKEEMRAMKFPEPNKEELRAARPQVVIKVTRGVGWVIFIAFLAALVLFGLYELVTESAVKAAVKVAVLGAILGVVLLFVSVLHQRIVESRDDKYKEVER